MTSDEIDITPQTYRKRLDVYDETTMTDLDEISVTVDLDVKDKNWRLVLMREIFDDMLGVEDNYEYAIGVLLDYATKDHVEGDIEDALEEITGTL